MNASPSDKAEEYKFYSLKEYECAKIRLRLACEGKPPAVICGVMRNMGYTSSQIDASRQALIYAST